MRRTTDRPSTARRTGVGAALALTLLSGSALVAAPVASATPRSPGHHRCSPASVPLPDGFRPEGITSGPGTTFYAGSVGNGAIWRGDLRTGTGRYLLPGATGRSLRGLQYDPRTGLVWAVGNDAAGAKVWAVNARTGAVVRAIDVPGGAFLNDLVVTRAAVWVTDSRVDRLTRVALTEAGRPTSAAPTFVPLSGAWPTTTPAGLGANGIRRLADGQLVLNNSTAGGLFAVKARTGVATAIPVSGAKLVGGDGLELRGATLYDVRGSGTSTVSVLTLRRTSAGWTATNRGDLRSPLLDVPSTATLNHGALYAVNARFGVASPGTATYSVTRLPLRP